MHSWPVLDCNKPQRQIDAAGNACGRDNTVILNEQHVAQNGCLRKRARQRFLEFVMGGETAAIQQTCYPERNAPEHTLATVPPFW